MVSRHIDFIFKGGLFFSARKALSAAVLKALTNILLDTITTKPTEVERSKELVKERENKCLSIFFNTPSAVTISLGMKPVQGTQMFKKLN